MSARRARPRSSTTSGPSSSRGSRPGCCSSPATSWPSPPPTGSLDRGRAQRALRGAHRVGRHLVPRHRRPRLPLAPRRGPAVLPALPAARARPSPSSPPVGSTWRWCSSPTSRRSPSPSRCGAWCASSGATWRWPTGPCGWSASSPGRSSWPGATPRRCGCSPRSSSFWGIRSRHWWWAVAAGRGGRGQPPARHRARRPGRHRAGPGVALRPQRREGGRASPRWSHRCVGAGAYLVWVGVVVRQLPPALHHPGPAPGRHHRPAQPAVGRAAPDGRARAVLRRAPRAVRHRLRGAAGAHLPLVAGVVRGVRRPGARRRAGRREPQLARALRPQRLPAGAHPGRAGQGRAGRQGAHHGARRRDGGARARSPGSAPTSPRPTAARPRS